VDVERVREVAKGRVWTGADARRHGLVDELGGLDEAIDVACSHAGIRRKDAQVRSLPRTHPLQALRPAQSSESPAAAVATFGGGAGSLLDHVFSALQVPAYGVLTAPMLWELR
jgi:protease IV